MKHQRQKAKRSMCRVVLSHVFVSFMSFRKADLISHRSEEVYENLIGTALQGPYMRTYY